MFPPDHKSRSVQPRPVVALVGLLLFVFGLQGCAESGPSAKQTVEPEAEVNAPYNAEEPVHGVPPSPPIVADSEVAGVLPVFENVASELGVEFTFYSDTVPDRFLLPEIMGGGAAWIDIEMDGQLDLCLMNGTVLQPQPGPSFGYRNALYRRRSSGKFSLVPAEFHSDRTAYGQGCIVGDFNADGFPDLCLTCYGPDFLLMNNGDGTFTDVTVESGVGNSHWSTSGVWVDVDGDSNLDLLIVNYLDVTAANNKACFYGDTKGYCGPGSYEGIPDSVYLNQGDGRFIEAAEEMGFNPFAGKGLVIAVADFDQDFRPDIYVGNDMTANFLYTRQTEGIDANTVRYKDVAPEAGCAVSGEGMNEATMGISCADFDRDGLTDIFLTHYFEMKNTLYHNLGGMLFEDDSWRTNVAASSFPYLGFGTSPLDFNGDGAMDLFIANGHVLGPAIQPSAMPPQLLQNDGRGNLKDVSRSAGGYFQDLWLGRGVAAADFDDDGDMDLAVTHLERPVALLENKTETGHRFLGLSLQQGNRILPLGAQVTVTTASDRILLTQNAGGSYLSTGDSRLLFSLKEDNAAVEISWPSGRRDRFGPLATNQYWRIIEGRSPEMIPR